MSDQDFLTEDAVKNLLSELLDERDSKLDRKLEVFLEKVQSSSTEWLDELISDAEALEDDEDEDEDEFDYTGEDEDVYEDDYEEEAEVTRPDPELLRLKKEMDKLKREREQEREAREQAERNQKVSAMEAEAIKEIRESGKVSNPEAFFKLLKADGHLVEDGKKFAIKAKDEFGELKKSVADSIEGLVEKDYSFMAPSRPGTGTGATQGSSTSLGSGMKYFDREGKPKVDPGQAMVNDREGYMKELAQVKSL